MPREHTQGQVMRHVMTRSHTEGEVVRHELYYHLLVRPRPVAGKMRFRCLPDRLRSRSYPLHPTRRRTGPLSRRTWATAGAPPR